MEFNANNLININGGQLIEGTITVKHTATFVGSNVKIDILYFLNNSWAAVRLAAIREEEVDVTDDEGNFIERKTMPVRSFLPTTMTVNVSELGNFEGISGLNQAVESIVLNAINVRL
jgi:hypothetical protein